MIQKIEREYGGSFDAQLGAVCRRSLVRFAEVFERAEQPASRRHFDVSGTVADDTVFVVVNCIVFSGNQDCRCSRPEVSRHPGHQAARFVRANWVTGSLGQQ